MDIEILREYCISKEFVSESFPFDLDTLVFKVYDKMFLYTSLESGLLTYKASPEDIIEQRERYSAVEPGYHMSKKHWNSLYLQCNLPDKLILQWVDLSYNLVLSKISNKAKQLYISEGLQAFVCEPKCRFGDKKNA